MEIPLSSSYMPLKSAEEEEGQSSGQPSSSRPDRFV